MAERGSSGDEEPVAAIEGILEELALLVSARTFIVEAAEILSGRSASLMVDSLAAAGDFDVLVTCQRRNRSAELLEGALVVLRPEVGPIRYGRLGATGQLRIRGVSAAAYRLHLRPPTWLRATPEGLGVSPARDLALVAVTGVWPSEASYSSDGVMAAHLGLSRVSTEYESADRTLRCRLTRVGGTGRRRRIRIVLSGPDGDPGHDGRVVTFRLGEDGHPVEEVAVNLRWDGTVCSGVHDAGDFDPEQSTLVLPDTLVRHRVPRAGRVRARVAAEDVGTLVELAADVGEFSENRLAALDELAGGFEPTPSARRLLDVLGSVDPEVRCGALAALGAGASSWAVPAVAAHLTSGRQPAKVRAAAAAALGSIGTPDALDALVAAIGHSDAFVRHIAARNIECHW